MTNEEGTLVRTSISALLITVLGLVAAIAVPSAHANDPCAAFTWDVSHERTLFRGEPKSLHAGQTVAASPKLAIDRLYQLQLKRQPEVVYVAPPRSKSGIDGGYAGLASLAVKTTGLYRIALDQPLWIDVVANGSLVLAKDFQGRRGCNSPHKIVEFELPAGIPLTLQFSGGSTSMVKVVVTRSSAKAS